MSQQDEFHIPESGREILEDPVKLQQYVKSGRTIQEIIGFSQSTMNKFYSAACRLFEKQKYEEASDAFIFLTTMNPFVHCYWLGLGMSEHMVEEYSEALLAYNMAIVVDKTNPIPYYHASSCHRALKDLENALISLDHAIHAAGNKEVYLQIKNQALAARKSMLF